MKTIKHILCVLLLSGTYACTDWLQVEPQLEISSEELYSSGDGYRMQLLGIYQALADKSLYGKELTWGLLDVIGQYYESSYLQEEYMDADKLDYDQDRPRDKFASIWSGMYNAIANCNNLIENIVGADASIFEYGAAERDRIYGEALAVRAFVHFDLLRLFAPAPVTNDNGKYIPYVTNYKSITNNPLTVNEVLEKIEADFKMAFQLMVPFDSTMVYNESWNGGEMTIRVWQFTSNHGRFGEPYADDEVYPMFFTRQGHRIILSTVNVLLARLYAYKGEKEKAYNIIQETFPIADGFSDPWSFDWGSWMDDPSITSAERKLLGDVAFGLYNPDCGLYYNDYMSANQPLYLRNISGIFPPINQQDCRYKNLMISQYGYKLSIKNRIGNSDLSTIPILRKSELYYIMGEYLASEGRYSEAVALLTELKSRRGDIEGDDYSWVNSYQHYQDVMLADARREFIGEGQSFYLYKRLNLPIFDGNRHVNMTGKFVIPIPLGERDFLNN